MYECLLTAPLEWTGDGRRRRSRRKGGQQQKKHTM